MLPDNVVTNDGDLIHFSLLTDIEPINFIEAVKELTWKNAMLKELKVIKKNKTWELAELTPNKKPIFVKWVFKLKLNSDGSIAKHKARLVAKSFLQKLRVDYKEVFTLVAMIKTLRLMISLASKSN